MKQLVTILACLFIGFLVGSIIEYSRTHDIRLENNPTQHIALPKNYKFEPFGFAWFSVL